MINILQLAVKTLPTSSLPWAADLKKQFLHLPAVQIEKGNIPRTRVLRLRVKVDLLVMNYILKPEDGYRHPWSKSWPGWVNESVVDLTQTLRHAFYLKRHDVYHTLVTEGCENSAGYNNLTASTKTSCKDWCPTPYYIQAGKSTKIRLVGGNVTTFTVYTGWMEDFLNKKAWPQYPIIEFNKQFSGSEGEFITAFGGTLMLKNVVSSVSADVVELEVSGGATEMAHFFLGKTTMSEWRRVKKFQNIAPWMILTAPSISLRFPSIRFNVAQNPEELMNTWERIVDNANEFHSTGYKGDYENILYTKVISNPNAWMISGNPVRAYQSEVAVGGNNTRLRNRDDQHGYLHEIGHNRDLMWWKFGGGDEVTNNMWSEYLRWILFGQLKSDSRQHRGGYLALKDYINGGANYSILMARTFPFQFFYQLHLDFGWNTYFHATKMYRNVTIRDDQDRRNWFLITLSKYLKRDMQSFLGSWGFKFTEEAISTVKQLGYPQSKYSAQGFLDMLSKWYFLEEHTKFVSTNLSLVEKTYKSGLKNETEMVKKDGKKIVEEALKAAKAVTSESTKRLMPTLRNVSKQLNDGINGIVKNTEKEFASARNLAKTAIAKLRNDFIESKKASAKAIDHEKGRLVADIKKAKKKRDETKKKAKTGTNDQDDPDIKLNNEIELLNATCANSTQSVVAKLRNNSESSLITIREAKKSFSDKVTQIFIGASANLNTTTQSAILQHVVTHVEKEASITSPIFDSIIKDAENSIKIKASVIRSNLSLIIENGTAILDDLVEYGRKMNLYKEVLKFRPKQKARFFQLQYTSAIERYTKAKEEWKLGVDTDTKGIEEILGQTMDRVRNSTTRIRDKYDQDVGKETSKTVGAVSGFSQKALDKLTVVIGRVVAEIDTEAGNTEKRLQNLMEEVTAKSKV